MSLPPSPTARFFAVSFAGLFASTLATSQSPPCTPLTGNVDGGEALLAVDLDGDLDEDVVLSSEGVVKWLENDGAGNYAPPVALTNGSGVDSIAAVDIDGDGALDLVVTDGSGGEVAWFANGGAAGFGSKTVVAASLANPLVVRAGDLDGDLDLDLVVGTFDDQSVTWYENVDGAGTFASAQLLSAAEPGVRALFLADLDQDSHLDVLVVSPNDGRVAWFENTDGLGTFGARQTIDDGLTSPAAVLAADLDGDLDLDVAVVHQPYGQTLWYPNLGGTFGSPSTLGPSGTIQGGSRATIEAKDLDGDLDLDLLVSNRLSWVFDEYDRVYWFQNTNGLGSFGPALELPAPPNSAVGATASDMDGDSDRDVLVLGSGGVLFSLENTNGAGAFGPEDLIAPRVRALTSLSAFDVDGDLDPDLLYSNSSGGLELLPTKIGWFENGSGAFGEIQSISDMQDEVRRLLPVDLTNDGVRDLVWTDIFLVGTQVGLGLGVWAPPSTVAAALTSTNDLRSGDFDGDGFTDVLQCGVNNIAWYRNNAGDGTLAAATVVPTPYLVSLQGIPADIDDDGDLDVVLAGFIEDEIGWMENSDAQGTFTTYHVIASQPKPQAAVLVDVDGDEDLDLLAGGADGGGGLLLLYENTDGIGGFGPGTLVDTAVALALHSDDFDVDGDPDLLVASSLDGVFWLPNLGGGSFGPRNEVDANASPSMLDSADFDGDGDPDFVYGGGSDLGWCANEPCGPFLSGSEVVRLGVPPNPQALLGGISGPPRIGRVWDPVVDHTTFSPTATADFLLVSPISLNISVPPLGTVLCGLNAPVIEVGLPGEPFAVGLPLSCELAGVAPCAQAGSLAANGLIEFTNALDLVLGTP